MKTYNIVSILLVVFLLSGCDDFLDVVPKGQNTLNSLDDLETLLNDDYAQGWAVYEDLSLIINESYPAQSPSFYIEEGKGLIYGYMTYDESIDRVSLSESNNLYAQTYEKITAYNVLISQIGDVEGDAARKGQLVAEAKTLRAWCHWILVNVFARAYTPERINEGGIPYVTDVNFEEVNEKLSLGKVYEKLLEDLSEENLSLLPDVPENIQRVGKAFGYAVKAKVLLSMQDYAGALQAAETALSFNSNIEDRRGYIGGTPVKTRDAANNLFFAPGSYAAPVWNVISAEWAQLYEQGDILRYYTDLYTDASATQGIEGCYTWENGTEYVYNSSGMRVEDMILVKAECQAREKDIEGAMNTLNDLRRYRVHPDAYQLLEAETETEAMEYIIRAALIEHLFTYTNFFDLKRWNTEDVYKRNITRTVNGVTYTLVPDSPYWVIPFPTDATQYNSSLTQNF